MLLQTTTLFFSLSVVGVSAQTYSATYLPSDVPATTEDGQSGTNQCGTTASDTSNCQNVYSAYSPRGYSSRTFTSVSIQLMLLMISAFLRLPRSERLGKPSVLKLLGASRFVPRPEIDFPCIAERHSKGWLWNSSDSRWSYYRCTLRSNARLRPDYGCVNAT